MIVPSDKVFLNTMVCYNIESIRFYIGLERLRNMEEDYDRTAALSLEEQIKKSYREDEDMMILVFAQWCINHSIDPEELYSEAYPHQPHNERLLKVLELTVSKEEAGDIPDDTLLGVLSLFGNHDLAFVVTEAISRRP